ncbi:TadE/TadG family type IV pilus assembly protein [Nocardioides sambongensis]|uniref:TadE/TadG family type IV pilus assembly protein n=1 Tax=Nocardioides sambongensis TaxID=2589074 RepID=UPI001E2AA97B|nr:TadE family protein [Nocardioides sambongensis]
MNRDDERGSVSVWVATATVAMIVLVGLAVDLGGQVHTRQRVHDVAAQAARAGGEQVQAAPAVQGRYVRIDAGSARSAAQEYLRAAGVSGTVTITAGDTITVTVRDTYDTQFLPIIGVRRLEVGATASARLVRTLGGSEQ